MFYILGCKEESHGHQPLLTRLLLQWILQYLHLRGLKSLAMLIHQELQIAVLNQCDKHQCTKSLHEPHQLVVERPIFRQLAGVHQVRMQLLLDTLLFQPFINKEETKFVHYTGRIFLLKKHFCIFCYRIKMACVVPITSPDFYEYESYEKVLNALDALESAFTVVTNEIESKINETKTRVNSIS